MKDTTETQRKRPLLLTFLPGGMTMSYYCGVVACLYDFFELSNITTFGASIGCCPAFALLTGMTVENMMRQTVELLLVFKTRWLGPFCLPNSLADTVLRKCTNPWAERRGEIWFGLTKIPSFTLEAISLNKAVADGVSPVDLFAASICIPPFFTRPHVVKKLGHYVDGGVGQFMNFIWDNIKRLFLCGEKVKTVNACRTLDTGCRKEIVISPCYFLPGDITPSKSERLTLQDHLFAMTWERNKSQFKLGYENILAARNMLTESGLQMKSHPKNCLEKYLENYERIWKKQMDPVKPRPTFFILSMFVPFALLVLDFILEAIYSVFYFFT